MSYQLWRLTGDTVVRVGVAYPDSEGVTKAMFRAGVGHCVSVAERGGLIRAHPQSTPTQVRAMAAALANGRRPDGNVPAADLPPPGAVPAPTTRPARVPPLQSPETPVAPEPAMPTDTLCTKCKNEPRASVMHGARRTVPGTETWGLHCRAKARWARRAKAKAKPAPKRAPVAQAAKVAAVSPPTDDVIAEITALWELRRRVGGTAALVRLVDAVMAVREVPRG